MPNVLLAHQTVLERIPSTESFEERFGIEFRHDSSNFGPDVRLPTTNVVLSHAVWADMGRPNVVTVKVERGDTLNPPEDVR